MAGEGSGGTMDLARYFWAFAGAAIAGFVASSALAQNALPSKPVAQPQILQNCQSCHGVVGDNDVTSTPRLNGQQAEYIVARLKKFSDVTRSNPHARVGMFKELSMQGDAAKAQIAQYFANQPPTSAKPGARAAEGKLIYEAGIAADNVIACKQCHGAQGEGHGATPRIAGQHADYLRAQLRLFSMKFHEHVLMNPNTKT